MANVSIFVPHNGCPQKCSFCDQRKITGCVSQPTEKDVASAIEIALDSLKEKSKDAEIAFFGGSFTAIDREYMTKLLESTKDYIHLFKGIRISTRPDAVNDEILTLLKSYGVTSIELGAQSMSDKVLDANDRGHSAKDVENASALIKKYGFSLGLQMMTGLYKSTPEDDIYTAERFISLAPDTVRIYPTVVLEDTRLAELFAVGEYTPLDVEGSVELCSKLILMFEKAGINIIRVGLHASDTINSRMVGGAYHPAFRELCENKIFFDVICAELERKKVPKGDVSVFVNSKNLSKAIGQKGINKNKLTDMGYNVCFLSENSLENRRVLIKKG